MTCRKIRYTSRTVTADDHARPPPGTDPQVTAVDDQFGTHTLSRSCRFPQLGLLRARNQSNTAKRY
jgi:hypothetical protein